MSEKMSVEAFRQLMNGQTPKAKKSKMSNVKTVVDGKSYDSKKEALRASELLLRVKAGEITALMEQVTYHFADTKYIADFVYLDRSTGQYVVEDVKGHRTATYIHKRKLMLKYYNIKILES